MKRILMTAVIVYAIAALPAIASAQQAGVKAGVNFATLSPQPEEFLEDSQRLGLVAGGWVRALQRDRFSFQVEALFSEKGISLEFDEEGIEFTGDIRIRYIEIPLLGRADLGTPGSTSGLYVFAGAAPAFKLSAHVKGEALGQDETMDIGDEIKSFDLGLVGGAGFEFGRVSIEGRYTYGLTSILKDEEESDKPKNRVISVMVGYRFR